ncbi:MAG: S41 family peptidase [Candidatus Marinimicrobia bacterium]|nr:S41 family peptidase [Candidatus Neomarinimicrobiota bacterium]
MKRNKTMLILISFVIIVGVSITQWSKVSGNVDDLYLKMKVFSDIMAIANENYVEEVDWEKAMEGAYRGLLEELDPHSVYIEKKDTKEIEEKFKGEFQGIGIQFDIIDGYITVISPIVGTPSEQVGLQSGDKFIEIDGESAYKITKKETFNKLRGKKGTKVNIKIKRSGVKEPFDVEIIRDDIPIYSVIAKFIYDDNVGYIKVNRFAAETANEFRDALSELKKQGMESLILDLRHNSGGYLHQAVAMLDFFFDKGVKFVYTEGRISNSNAEYFSSTNGEYTDIPLIVLINRESASASEIVSGAVQDLDRGLIVGTTSFGKGLVQRQWTLRDGSALRITIAQYFTPSGRLIQRPYEDGTYKYYEELYTTPDSIFSDSLDSDEHIRPKFKTKSGRTVYGGGGITPDISVKKNFNPSESTYKIYRKSYSSFFQFAQKYLKSNTKFKNMELNDFVLDEKLPDNFIDDFYEFVSESVDNLEIEELKEDKLLIKLQIKSEIAKILWGNNAFYKAQLQGDEQFEKAFDSVNDAKKIANL